MANQGRGGEASIKCTECMSAWVGEARGGSITFAGVESKGVVRNERGPEGSWEAASGWAALNEDTSASTIPCLVISADRVLGQGSR